MGENNCPSNPILHASLFSLGLRGFFMLIFWWSTWTSVGIFCHGDDLFLTFPFVHFVRGCAHPIFTQGGSPTHFHHLEPVQDAQGSCAKVPQNPVLLVERIGGTKAICIEDRRIQKKLPKTCLVTAILIPGLIDGPTAHLQELTWWAQGSQSPQQIGRFRQPLATTLTFDDLQSAELFQCQACWEPLTIITIVRLLTHWRV